MKFFLILLFTIISMNQLHSQDSLKKPLTVVPSVDIKRYCGTWYEIARLPNRFQKECAGFVSATYTLLENGDIEVVNKCRNNEGEMTEAVGKARIKDKNGPNTKLEVRFAPAILSFLPFVWGNYWIIDLAPDYSYAVIGEPNREYLWILSRSPQMDDATYREILYRITEQGYDVSRLVRTKQAD